MKAQIVKQVEFFSEAELESLEFVPEELEAIESERVPDLESISFEEVAKDLEAYFEGDVEGARLEASVQNLPPELLLKIGQYLKPKDNRKFRVALRVVLGRRLLPPR